MAGHRPRRLAKRASGVKAILSFVFHEGSGPTARYRLQRVQLAEEPRMGDCYVGQAHVTDCPGSTRYFVALEVVVLRMSSRGHVTHYCCMCCPLAVSIHGIHGNCVGCERWLASPTGRAACAWYPFWRKTSGKYGVSWCQADAKRLAGHSTLIGEAVAAPWSSSVS